MADAIQDFYRSLLAERGWAPIAGGSPELEKEKAAEVPETPEAPDTGQATESEESFADFDPSQVPEEARPYVEGLQKEWQSNYSKKRQAETSEIAEERKEAAEIRQFAEALENDPAARDAWLAERHGYQFENPEETEEFLDPEDELRARLEKVEGSLTAQQQEYAENQQSEQALDQIAEGIAELEKSWGNGFEFEGETLKAVEAYALVHGPQAIPEIGKAMQQIGQQDKQNWIDSKKSPRRITQGTVAKKAIDPTNREERYALYDQVAEEASPSLEG